MSGPDRRRKILGAALEVIGEKGLVAANNARIARRAGVTNAALYLYFENREDLLRAALNDVYDQMFALMREAPKETPVQWMRAIMERYQDVLTSGESPNINIPRLLLEFVTSAHEEGLRELVRQREIEVQAHLASVLQDFQRAGLLSQSVNEQSVAWMAMARGWTGMVADAIGLIDIWATELAAPLEEFVMSGVPHLSAAEHLLLAESPAAAVTGSIEPRDGDGTAGDRSSQTGLGLPEGSVFTVDEAADIMKVDAGTVNDLIRERRLGALSLGDQVRIPRTSLLTLLGTAGTQA